MRESSSGECNPSSPRSSNRSNNSSNNNSKKNNSSNMVKRMKNNKQRQLLLRREAIVVSLLFLAFPPMLNYLPAIGEIPVSLQEEAKILLLQKVLLPERPSLPTTETKQQSSLYLTDQVVLVVDTKNNSSHSNSPSGVRHGGDSTTMMVKRRKTAASAKTTSTATATTSKARSTSTANTKRKTRTTRTTTPATTTTAKTPKETTTTMTTTKRTAITTASTKMTTKIPTTTTTRKSSPDITGKTTTTTTQTSSSLSSSSLHWLYSLNQTRALEIGCCGHARPSLVSCHQTCYTERACTDPYYPFTSRQEKEYFRAVPEPKNLTAVCDAYMDQERKTAATTTWCPMSSSLSSSSFLTTASSKGNNNKNTSPPMDGPNGIEIPFGCSRNSMGERSGPFDRMVIIPQGKLALCGIPKVGITQWIKFARFVLGAADYQSMAYRKADFQMYTFDKFSPDVQKEIWTDPSWTKAIFLRHPAERLLSAYLNKVDSRLPQSQRGNVSSFANWIQSLDQDVQPKCQNQTGPSWCFDPHWRPQVYSCGIQHGTLPNFDFVGRMDHAAPHSKALLERVGLWESHGIHYTTTPDVDRADLCLIEPPNVGRQQYNDKNNTTKLIRSGFQQDVRAKADHHTTNSKSKLDRYFTATPHLWEMVQRMYQADFDLWNALSQDDDKDNNRRNTTEAASSWVSGRELAHRLNPQCPIGDGGDKTTTTTPATTTSTKTTKSTATTTASTKMTTKIHTTTTTITTPRKSSPDIRASTATQKTTTQTTQSSSSLSSSLHWLYSLNQTRALEIGCCGHARPSLVSCQRTCYTERACTDPYYPFTSRQEKEYFRAVPEPKNLTAVCDAYMDQERKTAATTTWCPMSSSLSSSSFLTTASSKGNNNKNTSPPMDGPNGIEIPFGCSRNSMGERSGPFDRMVIIPQGKLALCGIPKVGITQWIKFARFVLGAADYQSMAYRKADFQMYTFDKFSPDVQKEIWTDPSWTKAIFLRHPAERLLSAYLNKVDSRLPQSQRGAPVTLDE